MFWVVWKAAFPENGAVHLYQTMWCPTFPRAGLARLGCGALVEHREGGKSTFGGTRQGWCGLEIVVRRPGELDVAGRLRKTVDGNEIALALDRGKPDLARPGAPVLGEIVVGGLLVQTTDARHGGGGVGGQHGVEVAADGAENRVPGSRGGPGVPDRIVSRTHQIRPQRPGKPSNGTPVVRSVSDDDPAVPGHPRWGSTVATTRAIEVLRPVMFSRRVTGFGGCKRSRPFLTSRRFPARGHRWARGCPCDPLGRGLCRIGTTARYNKKNLVTG